MFDTVPDRYDLLNRLLTLRFDERWRKLAALKCLANKPRRVLDLCCGTGDLVLQLARHAPGDVKLAGLDYSSGMLELAQAKLARYAPDRHVQFTEGDASAMPYPGNHFDSVGIAFAFRNLTWRNPLCEPALAEVLRVLKPGGRFVIIETSQPHNPVLRACLHANLRFVTAPLGSLVSGHPQAYRYLALSARKYYGNAEVTKLLTGLGFTDVVGQPLLGGIAAIHFAIKPR